MKHLKPLDNENELCFHILTFDLILDTTLTPFLINVNSNPCLNTEVSTDYNVKRKFLIEVINKLCLRASRKKAYVEQY